MAGGGNPPPDDDEAVARILVATRGVIDEGGRDQPRRRRTKPRGDQMNRSPLLPEYRRKLPAATAMDAVGGLLDRIAANLRNDTRPDEPWSTGSSRRWTSWPPTTTSALCCAGIS